MLQNTLYVIGGCFNQTDSLSTLTEHVHPFGFAYNPRKDSWARISPMNRERCRFTLIPCGKDKLVAIGGSGRVNSNYHFEMKKRFKKHVHLLFTNYVI